MLCLRSSTSMNFHRCFFHMKMSLQTQRPSCNNVISFVATQGFVGENSKVYDMNLATFSLSFQIFQIQVFQNYIVYKPLASSWITLKVEIISKARTTNSNGTKAITARNLLLVENPHRNHNAVHIFVDIHTVWNKKKSPWFVAIVNSNW